MEPETPGTLDQFRDALRAVLAEVCVALHDEPFPLGDWVGIRFGVGGRITTQPMRRPDRREAARRACEAAKGAPSLRLLYRAAASDRALFDRLMVSPIGTPIADRFAQDFHFTDHVLCLIVIFYLKSRHDFHFDERRFAETWAAVQRQLTHDVHTETYWTPLVHLAVDGSPISLRPGWVVRVLEHAELEERYNDLGPWSNLDLQSLLRSRAVLEASLSQPRDAERDLDAWLEEQRTAIDLVRLVSDANVRPLFTLMASDDVFGHYSGAYSDGGRAVIRRIGTIRRQDGTPLAAFWDHLERGPNAGQVRLALRRWSDAAERPKADDRLLDYWIGLESLFAQDSTNEVKFRATLRIATFLGGTTGERELIFDEMRHSYDWRSTIIHGATAGRRANLERRGGLEETAEKTRRYLRRALLKMLEATTRLDLTAIERELLRG